MDDIENPRVHLGANNPPAEADPFDALKVHADDLLDQARSIAKVETADQLAAVETLADELKDAAAALEAERVARKAPHDDAIEIIQSTFNPYLAPLKNKAPGKIPLALDVIAKAKTPYLNELDRLKREAAEKLRREAEEAARIAAEAARAAAGEDMEAREEAEALVTQAQTAARIASRAENAATTKTGLRSYWSAVLVDPMAALKHYIARDPEAVKAFLTEMGRKDVLAGTRSIPGYDVVEERRAA